MLAQRNERDCSDSACSGCYTACCSTMPAEDVKSTSNGSEAQASQNLSSTGCSLQAMYRGIVRESNNSSGELDQSSRGAGKDIRRKAGSAKRGPP